VSFDIFLQAFEGGAAGRASDQPVLDVLEPLIADREGGWARIATADGEADVHGLDDPGSGLMINHASGRAVWDLMFELARAAGFVVMPVGCGTCVVSEAARAELPEGVPEPVVTVRSGADLLRAVESA
jgi:hypothetical protein